MSFHMMDSDTFFSLEDWRCLLAVVLWTIGIFLLSYRLCIWALLSKASLNRKLLDIAAAVAIMAAFVYLSGTIESIIASIIGSLATVFSGRFGSVGYPWGDPPRFIQALTCLLAVAVASRKKKPAEKSNVT
jgi:hypothetical protein